MKQDLLDSLNSGGVCKTFALKKYAKENNIPILRTNTANLLSFIVSLKKPKRILEIGTAIGYSGTILLENSESDAILDTIELKEDMANLAKENFLKLNYLNRVNIYCDDAKNVLPNLKEKYDFIFLDGPKAQYIHYLPYLITLLNENGILFADNVLFKGLVFSGEEVQHKNRTIVKNLEQFLIEISENPMLKTQIIDIEDGVSISKKENI